jgi:hypothetical protein
MSFREILVLHPLLADCDTASYAGGTTSHHLIFSHFSANLAGKHSRKSSKLDLQDHALLPGVAEHAGPKDAASQPEKAII